MQLAYSFALRSTVPDGVLGYLARAQRRGLEALWQKLCQGKLPARCTKAWYFETFCGVEDAKTFEPDVDSFTARTDIARWLNGNVKPCNAAHAHQRGRELTAVVSCRLPPLPGTLSQTTWWLSCRHSRPRSPSFLGSRRPL